MPYEIRNHGAGHYEVVNIDTGVGHGITTKANAEKQIRLLRAVEHGWKPGKLRKK